jgi:hypothetical protein
MTHRLFTSILCNQAGPGKHTCPSCNGSLMRAWRRPVDRFITQFVPMHRYRCVSSSCRWEGNFRTWRDPDTARLARSHTAASAGIDLAHVARDDATPKSFLARATVLTACALLVAIFAAADWLSGNELAGAEPGVAIPLAFQPLPEQGVQFNSAEQSTSKPLHAVRTAFK